jgi:hypothetical protein
LVGLGNRQLTKREKIRARVLVAPANDGVEPFWATAEDLSVSGMFVNSVRPVQVDDHLALVIAPESGARLGLGAVVVHVLPGAGFGCKFDEVTARTRSLLAQLISRATPRPHANPTPSPRARRNTIIIGEPQRPTQVVAPK